MILCVFLYVNGYQHVFIVISKEKKTFEEFSQSHGCSLHAQLPPLNTIKIKSKIEDMQPMDNIFDWKHTILIHEY